MKFKHLTLALLLGSGALTAPSELTPLLNEDFSSTPVSYYGTTAHDSPGINKYRQIATYNLLSQEKHECRVYITYLK